MSSTPSTLPKTPVPAGEPAAVAADAAAAPGTTFSNASLYVGDLLADVVESNLYEIFSSVGSVASIRICRDNVTRRSLGYGYVNFHNPEDAARAIDILNYERIKGRQCRIMWSQRDPTLRKTGVGNVFVKNLDPSIDMQTLNDTFSTFGNILSCKVSTNKDGLSKGYGFVHFDSDEAANNAIKKANGLILLSKAVAVEKYLRRNERRITSDWTNVYIKNFPLEWSEEKIIELFSEFGKVTSIVLKKTEGGENAGFGFVNYESHEGAAAAVEKLNGLKVGEEKVKAPAEPSADGTPATEGAEVTRDKLMFVGKHQKKAERESIKMEQAKLEQAKKIEKYAGRNLYVRNFDDTIDEKRLMNEFQPFGTISSCVVMRSQNGVSKGYGFVCFSSSEEATKAVTGMNNKMLDRKPIYVALAQRKEQRKIQLEQARRQSQMARGGMPINPMFGGMPMPAYGGNMMARGPMPQQYMYTNMVPNMKPMPYNNAANGMQQNFNNRGANMRGGGRGGRGGAGGRGGRGGMQAAGQVRGPMSAPSVPGAAPAVNPRNQPLTPQALANASEEERTNMIGERLYPLVAAQYPEHASKITGMLLEMEVSDLLHFLESPVALNEKINEALQVLLKHMTDARAAQGAPVRA